MVRKYNRNFELPLVEMYKIRRDCGLFSKEELDSEINDLVRLLKKQLEDTRKEPLFYNIESVKKFYDRRNVKKREFVLNELGKLYQESRHPSLEIILKDNYRKETNIASKYLIGKYLDYSELKVYYDNLEETDPHYMKRTIITGFSTIGLIYLIREIFRFFNY